MKTQTVITLKRKQQSILTTHFTFALNLRTLAYSAYSYTIVIVP